MVQCKEFIKLTVPYGYPTPDCLYRCPRNATQKFAYCWEHCHSAREAAEALNASDNDTIHAAMLQYLTCQGKDHQSQNRETSIVPAASALATQENIQHKQRPGIGDLDLPFEILRIIISELTFADLRRFKATNSQAREIAISNPDYRDIVTHAPETLAILHRTGLLPWFTINVIHNVLTQSRCTTCHRRGGFVFFPSFKRCCERCAWYDDAFVAIDSEIPIMRFKKLGEAFTKHLPEMLVAKQAPRQGFRWPPNGTTLYVVSRTSVMGRARASGHKTAVDILNNQDARGDRPVTYLNWAMTVYPMPTLDQKTQTTIPAYQCKGCVRRQCGDIERNWASTVSSCEGCQYSLQSGVDIQPEFAGHQARSVGRNSCRAAVRRGRQYTEEEMLDHLSICGAAQALMKHLAKELQRPKPTPAEEGSQAARLSDEGEAVQTKQESGNHGPPRPLQKETTAETLPKLSE